MIVVAWRFLVFYLYIYFPREKLACKYFKGCYNFNVFTVNMK